MKGKEIDIEQFQSIEELYAFVEENAFILERKRDLTNLWVSYRNFAHSEEYKQKAQWEIDCALFDLNGSELFPLIYSNHGGDGDIKKYPDLSEFQEAALAYVKKRAETSTVPILKARYNHILWKCPKELKHRDYALAAIIAYTAAIQKYYKLFKIDKDKETPLKICKLYESLVAVCNEVKEGMGQLKGLTKFLLFEATDLEFYALHAILDDMLENPKIFKAGDFEGTLPLFEKEINKERKKSDDFLLVNYYLPTAIKIAAKVGADVKKWHNDAGLAYLRISDTEVEEDRYWIKQSYHVKAIEAFTFAGKTEKKKQAEKLYSDLKPKVKLSSVEIELDEKTQKEIEEYHVYIKGLGANILKQPPDMVYKTISSGYFFPRYDDVLKASEDKESSVFELFATVCFDNNKNITNSKFGGEEERNLYKTYSHYIRISILPYLYYIIIPGIESGKLSYENLIAYLADKTWVGKPHIKYDLGGGKIKMNWIGLLAPAIVEFFLQVQAWGNSKYYRPSFVLCVDSLTLKMEGLFRNFCERAQIPTSVNRKKGMQEAYVHNVLENEVLNKYFNEDDRLLFNYLFTNEGGLNLRNNVAHCFYDYEDYHLNQMLLLLAALLRLAKYDYKNVEV